MADGFELDIVPDSKQVRKPTEATFVVSSTPDVGYSRFVELSVVDLPTGAVATFDSNPIAADGSTTLRINTSGIPVDDAYTGETYYMKVKGTETPGETDYDWLLVEMADRLYPWSDYCGIPGGIPVRTTIYQTMTTANTPAQINAAIAACPVGQVVYLSAGTYAFGSMRMTTKSGVTVRGAGSGQTIITHSGVQILRYDGAAFSDAIYNSVSSGYTAGSTAIVLSATPHAYFVAGSLIAITEAQSPDKFATGIGDYARDGLSDGAPSLNGSRCFRYVSRIVSVSGNTINLATPIPVSFSASLTVRAHPMNIAGVLSQFGIEDMTFDGCSDPVIYYSSERCWFYRVEFDNSAGCDQGHIIFHNGFQNEVRRCYIHDAPGWPVVTEAMGIGVGYGTCNGLFIDNVTRRTSSAFIIYGSAANAILYNYAMDCTRANDPPGVVMPFIFYHGPQGLMNLVEGNIGPGYCTDGYHGSASHDTLFRNHMNGLCTGRYADRRVMNIGRGTYYVNVVGNIIGDASWNPTAYEGSGAFSHTDGFPYVLGYPNSGNSSMTPETTWSTYPGTYPDDAVASTMLRHGNYDYYSDAVVWDAGITDHDIPSSLFYDSKPAYFGSLTWPPIDPLTPIANATPAKSRWDAYAISGVLSDLFEDES